jgi:signal transduction histidine kinase
MAQVTSQQQTVAYQEGTATKMAVLTPLVEKDWVVSMAIPHAAILAPVRKAMGRTLLVGLSTALVGILAAFAMGRSLIGSIHQLSSAIERFGAGDTSARAPVLDPDERGQLSQAFNHMADALQSHQKRLEEMQSQKLESLGTLVAGIAHNLNNVLVIALGTASLRGESAVEPADRQAYQHIVKVCRRGRDIVKSLINFARPTPATQAPIELNAVIREVCALLESTARTRVRVVRALTEAPLWINGNAGDIDQILVNLGINALDAMPDQGTLTFRTAIVEAHQVEVASEDDGTGMTSEVLARALEPFYTTKEVGQGIGLGIGLGLSVTYGVVKAHGGSIDLASRPGQGTTVKLRFPRIPTPPEREAVPHPAPPLAFRKLLLVDDEEAVRFLMTRMLRKAGAGLVATAASGAEALEQLLAGDLPDVLILDQNMPGMTGTQVMAEVRSRHPELPILISSGQPDIENWACFRKPRMGVISKPFTLGEIQAKLAQFAGGPPAPGRTPPSAAP